LVEAIEKTGVKRIYGVVGDSPNGFTDALRRRKSSDWIHMRHEEAAAFAAGLKLILPAALLCAPAAQDHIGSGLSFRDVHDEGRSRRSDDTSLSTLRR